MEASKTTDLERIRITALSWKATYCLVVVDDPCYNILCDLGLYFVEMGSFDLILLVVFLLILGSNIFHPVS